MLWRITKNAGRHGDTPIFGDLISYQNDGKSRTGITRKLGDMSEYSNSCIDMRAAEVLISA
jgi:hypothetical protein